MLNARNKYRNTAFVVKRSQARKSRRKQQKGANPFGNPALKLNSKLARSIIKRSRAKRRRKQQKGSNPFLGPAAKLGVKLGRSKNYRRMSLSGFSDTGGRRYRKPWEV